MENSLFSFKLLLQILLIFKEKLSIFAKFLQNWKIIRNSCKFRKISAIYGKMLLFQMQKYFENVFAEKVEKPCLLRCFVIGRAKEQGKGVLREDTRWDRYGAIYGRLNRDKSLYMRLCRAEPLYETSTSGKLTGLPRCVYPT